MKIEYINPFIRSAVSVLKEFAIAAVLPGDVTLARQTHNGTGMVVMIGITGRLSGWVTFDMSSETATAIASAMMGGKATEDQSRIQSAIAELGNMISGNAAGGLAKEGYKVDITPPMTISGSRISMTDQDKMPVCLVAPLDTEHGKITLNLSLREA